MDFHEPELVEFGVAESLITVTIGGSALENPPDPEPNYHPVIVYINAEPSLYVVLD